LALGRYYGEVATDLLTLTAKEGAQQFRALVSLDTFHDLATVIEPIVVKHGRQRTHGPELGITAPEHDPPKARVQDRTSTEKTRLERAIEICVREALVPHLCQRCLQRVHLGVRQWRAEFFNPIVANSNETAEHALTGGARVPIIVSDADL